MIQLQTNKVKLVGCKLNQLTKDEINNLFNEISSGVKDLTQDFIWLLAFQFDGVIWGRCEQGGWHLSGDIFPEISPAFNRDALLEMRIFNNRREILIWRTNDSFRASELVHDYQDKKADDNPLRPQYENYLIRGDRVLKVKNGFSLLTDRTGIRQAVPLECSDDDFKRYRYPFYLELCHYFEQDDETGMVRISATRLLAIKKRE